MLEGGGKGENGNLGCQGDNLYYSLFIVTKDNKLGRGSFLIKINIGNT